MVSFFQIAISFLAYVDTFSGQLYFGKSYFFTLFQRNYFDTAVIFSEELFLQNSCFFLLFQNSHFFARFFFRNNFLFGGKLLPSYNTILRIIVPCYNSCKKNKELKNQSFRICLPVTICLSWWKNINKKGRNFSVPSLKYFQFGQDGWKTRTFFMKISWRWTCSQIFRKFSHWENLRLFWMMIQYLLIFRLWV